MAKKNMTLEEKLEEAIVKDGPYEVPGNWVWSKLGYIVELKSGGSVPDNLNNFDGDYLYVKVGDMNLPENSIEITNSSFRLANINEFKSKIIPNNSIIFPKRGGAISTNKKRKVMFPILVDTNTMAIIVPDKLNYNYIYYWFLSIDLWTLNNGSSIPQINNKDIEPLLVPVPSLKEQQRIVDRIESLFEKIDKSKELIEEARDGFEKRKSAVLEKAFRGELTKKWRENNCCENVHESLKDIAENRIKIYLIELQNQKKLDKRPGYNKPIPEDNVLPVDDNMSIPDLWQLCYIKNISEIVRGASPRPAGDPKYFGGEIPWITVKELTKDDNVYMNNVEQYLTEEGKEKSRYINEGTLLLTNSGATLGVPKITNINGCINDGILSFARLYNVEKKYIYYYLKSQTKKFRLVNQGAAQPNLNTDIVKNWLIPCPPLAEQKEIVKILDKLLEEESKIEELTQLEDQIELIKKSILAKAFRGELGTNSEEDESALGLLKEILSKDI